MSAERSRSRGFELPPMPGASGTECVRVLVGFGWMPVTWTPAECRLQRQDVELTVPLDPALSSAQVAELVELAGVSPYLFVDALEKLRTGRVMTMTDESGTPSKTG